MMPSLNRRSLLAGMAVAGSGVPALARQSGPRLRVGRDRRADTLPSLAIALERARPGTTIALGPGTWREKLTVTTPGITIEGEAGATIAFAAGAQLPSGTGGNWGTSGSAVLTIRAPGVTLRNLTIRNDHDYLRQPMQAVTLAVQPGGDHCRIERCRLEGWQDTLLLQAQTRVSDCVISGNIDFIFGGAAAWIERCRIVSRHAPVPPGGFLAAPSTPACQPFGLVFADCRLEREAEVPDGSVYLGRPWRAGGNMALLGSAIFLRCWMDAHIAPDGWTHMGYRDPAGEKRQLTPAEARFFEHDSRGPGAQANARRRRLTDATATQLTPAMIERTATLGC